MPSYRISGLTVQSDGELPGAIEISLSGQADIHIRHQPVPDKLDTPTLNGPIWELNERQFLLRLPGIGRFLASDGNVLDIDPEPGTDPADAMIFALGAGIGALLYQRGGMVLHASAIAAAGKAYAFCGRSGIGKSTLAARLCRSGCAFVSDDVSAIALDSDSRPIIWPDGRQLKLFENSIAMLELDGGKHAKVRSQIDKYYVEPPHPGVTQPMPLGGIYMLTEDRLRTEPLIETLSNLDAAQALLNESYRPRLALAMARSGGQLAVTTALLRYVPVYRLARPAGVEHLSDIVGKLKAQWSSHKPELCDAQPA